MSEDLEVLCLLICIFEILLLIGVVFVQVNLSIRRLNTLEACLDKWIYLVR